MARAPRRTSSPTWPDEAALDRALKQIAALSRRWCSPARPATSPPRSARWPPAGRSCSRRATAPRPSTTSRAVNIREKLRVILQMAVVLTYSSGVPVVKVGRMAGQFAKPRSSPTETRRRPRAARRFRGHIVNDPAPTAAARVPDPERLVQAYHQSASTLNLLRAFTKGGFADLTRVHAWMPGVRGHQPGGPALRAASPARSSGPCGSCGPAASTSSRHRQLHEVDFYTSHEALLLGYEEALTREDSLTGDWYDCSAHMLWIGERTRQLDGAHVEFLRGVGNPLGCKIGPTVDHRRGAGAVRGRSTPTGCPAASP